MRRTIFTLFTNNNTRLDTTEIEGKEPGEFIYSTEITCLNCGYSAFLYEFNDVSLSVSHTFKLFELLNKNNQDHECHKTILVDVP